MFIPAFNGSDIGRGAAVNEMNEARARVCVTLVLAVTLSWPVPADAGPPSMDSEPASASGTSLTLARRIEAQRAIEQVYWSQRIWPEGNSPKPVLSEVVSESELSGKVEAYLTESKALEESLGHPIATAALRGEIERMVRTTRRPGVLREIFAALGGDPLLIVECLARPVLVARVSGKPAIEKELEGLASGGQREVASLLAELEAEAAVPRNCTLDTWTSTPEGGPSPRAQHVAVWTGAEMIVWGGQEFDGTGFRNDGGRYDLATNSWSPTSTGANVPTPSAFAQAVWTGTEMIVWGGLWFGTPLGTGARYKPSTNTWIPMTATNAPDARLFHTAVWTGTEMIVWGGWNETVRFNSGGRYDPARNLWTPTSLGTGVPAPRNGHVAVWTGTEMIVWSGNDGSQTFDNGARYHPGLGAWTAIPSLAPSRSGAKAVWTGSSMIVWSGRDRFANDLNSGGKFDPVFAGTGIWTPTSTVGVPLARSGPSAVWTGAEVVFWGGYANPIFVNTGGRYNPSTNSWRPTSPVGAPFPRGGHSAVWTGTEMIVFGGGYPTLSTGGLYCATVCSESSCNDGNPCTNDGCDPLTGCFHSSQSGSCNDGNACTTIDSCIDGTCVGISPWICTSSGPCHVAGTCDPGTGACSDPPAPNGTPCSDDNLCTTGDACISGSCRSKPLDCNDRNACTTDSCDPEMGCWHSPIRCNDHDPTTTDACDPRRGCVFGLGSSLPLGGTRTEIRVVE
jgi:N-acetylneuraminic acid mutarotase